MEEINIEKMLQMKNNRAKQKAKVQTQSDHTRRSVTRFVLTLTLTNQGSVSKTGQNRGFAIQNRIRAFRHWNMSNIFKLGKVRQRPDYCK